jgi:hypothetical protein
VPPIVIWPPATSRVASLDLLSAGSYQTKGGTSGNEENGPREEETHDGLIPLAPLLYGLPPRCRARVGEVLESQAKNAGDAAGGEVDGHLFDETKYLALDGETTHGDVVTGEGAGDLARTIGNRKRGGDRFVR